MVKGHRLWCGSLGWNLSASKKLYCFGAVASLCLAFLLCEVGVARLVLYLIKLCENEIKMTEIDCLA